MTAFTNFSGILYVHLWIKSLLFQDLSCFHNGLSTLACWCNFYLHLYCCVQNGPLILCCCLLQILYFHLSLMTSHMEDTQFDGSQLSNCLTSADLTALSYVFSGIFCFGKYVRHCYPSIYIKGDNNNYQNVNTLLQIYIYISAFGIEIGLSSLYSTELDNIAYMNIYNVIIRIIWF